MEELRGKKVTVFGLGRFGGNIAASQWLASQGASVTVVDREPAEKMADSVAKLAGHPITFHLGQEIESDFSQADFIVASPAILPTNPMLEVARKAGVPITTEIRLFIERCSASIVAVTGTKGKSTTTAMLGRILSSRFTTWVGGNLGGSLLFDLPKIGKDDPVVLELSSYMLEHLRAQRWSPHVAVLTFIAPDHLEWHGGYEPYLKAKQTIVDFQTADDYVIASEASEDSMRIARASRGRLIPFGTEGRKRFELLVPGEHNQLNAQAAFAAASVLGVTWDEAQAALATFKGLPHRLQLVHEQDGVRYYNDSIATIPQAAIAALGSFAAGRVIQIVGGYDKHLDMDGMCRALAERAKASLCIGQLGPSLAERIRGHGGREVHDCGDLATAVARARELASSGDIVLLSTGCASYGQFTNFEARGDAFARLARGEA